MPFELASIEFNAEFPAGTTPALVTLLLIAVTAIKLIKECRLWGEWFFPMEPAATQKTTTRTVSTQSQTTYTSLRNVSQPRFLPLGEKDMGVFEDGLQLSFGVWPPVVSAGGAAEPWE